MIGRGTGVGFGRGFYGRFETQASALMRDKEWRCARVSRVLWDGCESENGLWWHDGFLALGSWAGSLCLSTRLARIVVDVFAVFLVCAFAREWADIARGEEGIDVVVLCVVFGHCLT